MSLIIITKKNNKNTQPFVCLVVVVINKQRSKKILFQENKFQFFFSFLIFKTTNFCLEIAPHT